jgi:hypothetical protein
MTAVVIIDNTSVIQQVLNHSSVINETEEILLIESSASGTLLASEQGDGVIQTVENQNIVVLSGIPGPPGPAGVSEEEMPYAKRVDSVSDTDMYKGEAVVGSSTDNAVWRIQKVVFGTDGDVTITWADGNANFDNVWDNRLSLSYL